MNNLQSYFKPINDLVDYKDYAQLTKRIIDLALDTGDVGCYKETVGLLDRLDIVNNEEERKELLVAMLRKLQDNLQDKPVLAVEGGNPLLSVNGLIRTYKNSAFSLGPISFEVREGKIIGLVGENGNGKTTLLRSLCGELQSTGGEIKYNFPYKDDYDMRSHLIYIPQRTDSWRGSLLSNLQFTAASYGLQGEENEYVVQLVIARMGLRKYRDYKWRNLSSGYKMRFELARALLRKPRLLLIDEPLANLDILAQQIVLDDFRDIARSPFRPLGIILSSQQLYEVEKTSDSVIFLKNGTPRNMADDTDVTYTEIPKFIVEFESEWDQGRLHEVFESLNLERLQINGGTYVASFPDTVTQDAFLRTILDHGMPISYFRNISNSTRRFFLS